MPTLQDQDIVDLAALTLKELGRFKFNDIASTLQSYEFVKRMMARDKEMFDDGIAIQRNLLTTQSGAAKMVGLFEEDDVNVVDVMAQLTVPWRHATTNYAWDRRELLTNRGGSRIVKILGPRRAAAKISAAELMETQAWSAPSGPANNQDVWGIPYWLPKDTLTAEGFSAAYAGTYADAAGIDKAVISGFQHYNFTYTNVTRGDLIKKLRTARRKTGFQSPVDIPDYRKNRGQRYRYYMNEVTLNEIETRAEDQNDNLGPDVASMDDAVTLKSNPLVYVPFLDADTNNPIYALDFAYFCPVFLKGDFMRETAAERVRNSHNVFVIHIDTTWNMLCTDLRRQAVGFIDN